MKTKRLIMLLGVAILMSATAHAQKVITEGSGPYIKVIIDASGIPHTIDKKVLKTGATDVDDVPPGSGLSDLASAESNAKVYKKFEVSKVNHSEGTTWRTAFDLCAGLNYNGSSGWRLPTQRELMLIWILHNDLKALGASVFTGFSANIYRSSTVYVSLNWCVDFSNGLTSSNYGKTSKSGKVRCIRDI